MGRDDTKRGDASVKIYFLSIRRRRRYRKNALFQVAQFRAQPYNDMLEDSTCACDCGRMHLPMMKTHKGRDNHKIGKASVKIQFYNKTKTALKIWTKTLCLSLRSRHHLGSNLNKQQRKDIASKKAKQCVLTGKRARLYSQKKRREGGAGGRAQRLPPQGVARTWDDGKLY